MSVWICVETGGRAEICTQVTWNRPETTGRDVWGDTEHEGANSQETTGTREGVLDCDFRPTLLMSSRGSFFYSKQKPLRPEPFVAPLTSSFCPYATFLKVWSKLLAAASTPSVNFWPLCRLVTTLTSVIYDVLVGISQSLYYRTSLPGTSHLFSVPSFGLCHGLLILFFTLQYWHWCLKGCISTSTQNSYVHWTRWWGRCLLNWIWLQLSRKEDGTVKIW